MYFEVQKTAHKITTTHRYFFWGTKSAVLNLIISLRGLVAIFDAVNFVHLIHIVFKLYCFFPIEIENYCGCVSSIMYDVIVLTSNIVFLLSSWMASVHKLMPCAQGPIFRSDVIQQCDLPHHTHSTITPPCKIGQIKIKFTLIYFWSCLRQKIGPCAQGIMVWIDWQIEVENSITLPKCQIEI